MVDLKTYTEDQIVEIYKVIEEAAMNNKPVNMTKLGELLKQGDFCMCVGLSGTLFTIPGLRWIEDGNVYYCLIQPQIVYGHLSPVWNIVITVNERDYSSSGILKMICKNNRYYNTPRMQLSND